MTIKERTGWPQLVWDHEVLLTPLAEISFLQGRLAGRMDMLGYQLREEATLAALLQDVLATSVLAGEPLDRVVAHAALATHLGAAVANQDQDTPGIVSIAIDALRNASAPLTQQRLFDWYTTLFPQARHRERLPAEMNRFLKWFNSPSKTNPVIKSALAHFWFVTIHPASDGNGRIGRALGDMLLARAEKSSQRFYSMSHQILLERDSYHAILEQTQQGTLDVTTWIDWYLKCLRRAMTASMEISQSILTKVKSQDKFRYTSLNPRQQTIINQLMAGTIQRLTSSVWAEQTLSSQDTALRDINDLVARNILIKNIAGGRSTCYELLTSEPA
jgi:hypothetical protein